MEYRMHCICLIPRRARRSLRRRARQEKGQESVVDATLLCATFAVSAVLVFPG